MPEEVEFESPNSDNESPDMGMRTLLQKAIDKQNFLLFAQPIVAVNGKEKYHEVLIRMMTPEYKLIFPDRFLSLGVAANLAADIDITVIEQTLRYMSRENIRNPQSRFSINVMPQTLCKSFFIEQLSGLFEKYAISPTRIIFEVVESDLLHTEASQKVLEQLRQLGAKLAIDDFGVGYSSHSRLKDMQADILKIDGSFIKNVTDNDFDRYSVESFCNLAKIKGMEVVAEYVENAEIQQALETLGVDWMQGYHLGKPQPISTL